MVYVVQRPKPKQNADGSTWEPNLQSAEEFGELKFLFESTDQLYVQPTRALLDARRKMANFDPNKDFVLWPGMGDPAALYAVLFALGGMGLPHVNMLYWTRRFDQMTGERTKSGSYYSIQFNLKGSHTNGN